MKKILAALTLVILPTSLTAAVDKRRSYSATAYALGGEEKLYVEKHVEIWRSGRLAEREVRYEDPAGRLIAEKVVRYGETPQAPSFEMTDYRIGLREGAEVRPGEILLFSGAADEGDRPRRLELPEKAVIDAGFDAFMRKNFDAVVAGEKIEFDFAVPAARRFFRFQLLPKGTVSYRGEKAFLVKMRPASALLRLAVDPIELVYSPDGRLLEFRGLANVWDGGGDRYKARIVFKYAEDASAAARAGAAQ